MTFKQDLKIGKQTEVKIMNLCEKMGHKPIPVEGKFKGYDFFVADTKLAYEVKYDPKSVQTGNLVIEIEMYGKPSGLMSTIADWWIFDTEKELITISPTQIKDCIVTENPKMVTFTGPGDDVPKKAYLIKKTQLMKYAEKIVSI